MPAPSSFSFKLTPPQQDTLERILRSGSYRLRDVPHARVAAEKEGAQIVLYTSGACVVQGKGAQDWVTFVLEPEVTAEARLGYEEVLDPDRFDPHMGVDESGKGDFFGPIVISAAYVDPDIVPKLQALNVRDSKRITSDRVAEDMAKSIRGILGDRCTVITVGPRAYNRLYASMRSVNRLLAWGHARAIENVLERVPTCPRAISDQFGPREQILRALMQKGRSIDLVTRTKAESDPAVAAASILARAAFIKALRDIGAQHGVEIPKGASAQVREKAVEIVRAKGPEVLLDIAKCHFKTTDEVLAAAGSSRAALGPDGRVVSKPFTRKPRTS